jgi:hypothetical protein
MGGTSDPSNLIELSVEEHAEAHRKLYEQNGNWQDYCAWQALSGRIGQEEILRMKQGMANKGKKRTPEQIERIKLAVKLRNERWKKDPKLMAEANRKRSESMKGRKKSKEAIENWKQSRKNNNESWHSKETKLKISNGLKGNTNRKTK